MSTNIITTTCQLALIYNYMSTNINLQLHGN